MLAWGKNRRGFPRTTWEVIPPKQCPFPATPSPSPSASLSHPNLSHNMGRATTGATPKSSEPHLIPNTMGPERSPSEGDRMFTLLHTPTQTSMATLLRPLANVSLSFAFSVPLTPSLMRIFLIFLSTFSHATQKSPQPSHSAHLVLIQHEKLVPRDDAEPWVPTRTIIWGMNVLGSVHRGSPYIWGDRDTQKW